MTDCWSILWGSKHITQAMQSEIVEELLKPPQIVLLTDTQCTVCILEDPSGPCWGILFTIIFIG